MVKQKYNIGDIVYVITDNSQSEWQITGILHRYNSLRYLVSRMGNEYFFQEFELSDTRDVIKATTN